MATSGDLAPRGAREDIAPRSVGQGTHLALTLGSFLGALGRLDGWEPSALSAVRFDAEDDSCLIAWTAFTSLTYAMAAATHSGLDSMAKSW